MEDQIARSLTAMRDELIGFRRDLHAHPELSRNEHRTTGRIIERLTGAGLAPRVLIGGVGVICEIGEGDGPIVGLRGDIDALPLDDVKDVPYRSQNAGVCHACGHDVHTTIVLGAGLALHEHRDRLPGRVRLIFQPAEEVHPGGANDVIDQGHLEGLSLIFGMHCDPRLPTGRVGLRVGSVTSAADFMTVHLRSAGGHTARPHLTTDPVYAAARVITDLPGALSRVADPRSPLSVIFGSIHGGTAPNVIATEVDLQASIRTTSAEVWETAPEVIGRLIEQSAASLGVECRLVYERGNPPLVNDAGATGVLAGAVRAQLGPGGETETQQSMGSEDFAWFVQKVPGAFGRLGVGIEGRVCDIHNADFDVDERAIDIGARVLAQAAWDGLRR